MSLAHDYEFVFPSKTFDQTVYDQCTLNDSSNTRLSVLNDTIATISEIFTNLPNLNTFSTFKQIGEFRYKITLSNN